MSSYDVPVTGVPWAWVDRDELAAEDLHRSRSRLGVRA
jgi:hypothetical protein